MSEHTKGNWKSIGTASEDPKDHIFYHADVLSNGTIRVARSSGIGEKQALANAQLIAAAPALLEACKDMQAALTEYHLRDVKKRYSLCVADAAVGRAIASAEHNGNS